MAVEARQVQIQQQHVGRIVQDDLERFLAIGGRLHIETALPEVASQQRADAVLVINNQDAMLTVGGPGVLLAAHGGNAQAVQGRFELEADHVAARPGLSNAGLRPTRSPDRDGRWSS